MRRKIAACLKEFLLFSKNPSGDHVVTEGLQFRNKKGPAKVLNRIFLLF